MKLLLTGGAGYIGSHTAVAALRADHVVHLLDDFRNSEPSVVDRIARAAGSTVGLTRADVRNRDRVAALLAEFEPDAVIHFAGLKAVGESGERPLDYYDVNVGGTISLLLAMAATGVRRIVFSSSATVYGTPGYLPLDEDHPLSPTNPYGESKRMVETVLADAAAADPGLSAAILRYFNPAGADASGLIGEDPKGVPQNLMPFLADVAAGKRSALGVFGTDYDTRDGTGLRDYIHVTDLAEAHLAALDWCGANRGARAFNVGGGTGTTVLEMVAAFERATGISIPLEFGPRRPGDLAAYYADPSRAGRELGWRARLGIDEICASAWAWRRERD